MLNESQVNYLKEKVIGSVWGNPNLETNLVINPKLLNTKYASYQSIYVQGNIYSLPNKVNKFFVYTLQHMPFSVLNLSGLITNKWYPSDEIINQINSMVRIIDIQTGIQLPPSTVNILVTYNGEVLLAISPDIFPDFNRHNLSMRIRNHVGTLGGVVAVVDTVIASAIDAGIFVNALNASPRPLSEFLVNGQLNRELVLGDLPTGAVVTEITDTLTERKLEIVLDTLRTYNIGATRYYLIDLDPNDVVLLNEMYSRDDVSLHLSNHIKESAFLEVGLYSDTLVQVTNLTVGLRTDVVESILAERNWVANTLTLTAFVRYGTPKQTYRGLEGYWTCFRDIPRELRERVLCKTLAAPEVLTAKYQQESLLNAMIVSTLSKLTPDVILNGLGISTIDNYLNRGFISPNEYGTQLFSLPDGNASTIINNTYIDGLVNRRNPDTALEEEVLFMGYPVGAPFSALKRVVIDSYNKADAMYKIDDKWTYGVFNSDYTLIGNELVWNVSFDAVDTLVIDSNSTVRLTLRAEHLQTIDATWIHDEFGHMLITCGDETLVRGLQYQYKKGTLVFLDKALDLTKELHLYYRPTLSMGIVETGFTRGGCISVNDTYLQQQKERYYVIVAGKLLRSDMIPWDETAIPDLGDLPNAKPYQIVDVSLDNYNVALHTVSDLHEIDTTTLKEVSVFKDANLNHATPPDSVYSSQYNMVSPFMAAVSIDVRNGTINTSRGSIESIGMEVLLADHLYILEDGLDPISNDDLPWQIIDLDAHPESTPLMVTANMWIFLQAVNNKYFSGIIQLNQNYLITQ